MHGAGSPAAQKIMIARRGRMDQKTKLAKTVAGIDEDKLFEEIVEKKEKDHWKDVKKQIDGKKVQIY
jgi:hypothetical protein